MVYTSQVNTFYSLEAFPNKKVTIVEFQQSDVH